MTQTSPAATTSGEARVRRRNTRRDNLFAATMLVPVIAVAGIAAGKLILRGGGLALYVVGQARAQQGPVPAAVPSSPPAGAPATPPAATPSPAATAPASTAPAAAASGAPSAAVTVLLEQASYWRNQSQYDQALESLNRALTLDPGNKDALALSGQIQADRGNRAAAENALARLRATAPADPRIAKIDQTLRVGPISQDALADARRLAREGHQAEAVERYNRVFRGNPPPDNYSVEYFQTLAGTEGGWEQARDGLARSVRQNPQDLRAQLAYAQILTYRDGSRAEGITRLAALARNPAVADQATQAWRQALGWLPDNASALDPLTVYLRAHPNDPDIANKLEQARNPTPNANDPSASDRNAGFTALNAGKLGDAAQDFQKALDRNANDSDATGGLGIVRLRQHNLTEARSLLSRAIALNPDERSHWQAALDGTNRGIAAATTARNSGGGGGGGGNLAAPAQALLNRGDYAGAERALLSAIATGRDNSGGLQSMLADAQAQQGRLGDAEGSYREALARNPRSLGALTGLAGVLSREGRSDEAQGLLSQAESLGGGRQVGQARAVMLREQAQNITDPATQAGLYREALSSDPSNPWLRLDYARTLVKLRQLPQARGVMGEMVGRGADNDALKAAIIFANETNDPDAAAALIARLPPSARTPDMRVLQADSGLQREIGQALEASPQFARERLLQMAAAPDPDGARGAAIARALGKLGDKAAARDAIVVAQSASRGQGAAARLAYAGAFLDNADPASARRLLGQIDPARVSGAQRAEYSRLVAGLAVRTADQLNEQGKHADAYDRLAPVLAQSPDSPDLNMALARIYQGNNDPREALAINEALLRRDPSNQDARRAAISAALQAGNRGLADTLVREGLEMAPNDPRMWMSSADVAKAAGNSGRALRDLQHARDLRLQQLGYTDNGADTSTLAGVSLAPGAPVSYGHDGPAPVLVPVSPWAASARRGNADGGADDSTTPWYSGGGSPPNGGPAVPLTPAVPLGAPTPLAPATQPRPGYGAPSATSSPGYTYGRVLDTSPTSLPPPRGGGGAQYAQSADDLNAREVNSVRGQPAQTVAAPAYQAPAYQAPTYRAQSVAPVYQAPSYQAPSYQAPAYQAPAYQTPAYQAPAYQAPASAPAYQAQRYPVPAYQPQSYQPAGYQPPAYPAAPAQAPYAPAQPPVPGQYLYQSQQQQFLPQYQPYQGPPPAPPLPPIPPTPPPAPGIRQYGAPSILNDTGRNGLGGYYSNPFRAGPSSVPADQGIPGASPLVQPDPETAEIDRSILQLRDQVAPTIQGGFGFRERSGDSGLDQLTELDAPIEAEASPGGYGRLKLTVTPTYLQSGSIAGDATNLQRFGTSVFGLQPGTAATNFVNSYVGSVPKSQFAQGVGVGASYNLRYLTADIGSTPLGFPLTTLVGGVELAPRLTDNLTLRLTGERRAMTDSILSYAGTTDTRSGLRWGGENRIRGHGNLEWGVGNNGGYIYAGAGAGNVTGTHVLSNTEVEAGAGGSFPVYTTPTQQLRVGLDLVYFGYKKNLRYFTLGQGGYFSPQSYAAALIPVVWKEQYNEDLTYEVGAAAGFQSYHEALSNYFPDDPGLQANLVAQQANTTTAVQGVNTTYPADSKSGFSGNAHAVVDYRVSPNLHLGLRAAVQKAGNYTEASGVGYARYIFNGTSGQ